MAKTTMMEKVSIITSAIRTLLMTVMLGALGYGGWYGYTTYNATEIEAQRATEALVSIQRDLAQAHSELESKNIALEVKEQEIGVLHEEVALRQLEIDRLDTAMRLLKVDHRMALIRVADQQTDEATNMLVTQIDFLEINESGTPIGEPRRFEIKGDVLYIDSWVVKFEDKYIEEADIDRATSLVLFRRIFGEMQEPREGFVLDEVGARPVAYSSGDEMSEFEGKIWSDFWDVANSESKQREMGIRAIHGEAPSIKAKKGKVYRVDLRASGGLSISSADDITFPGPPPA